MASCATGSTGFGKDLTCRVCGEIYRSPRLLSCSHTFCVSCLEDLTKDHVRTFRCPILQCRKRITIPAKRAEGFTVNPYITEEELERERNKSKRMVCANPYHDGEPVIYFCVNCEEPICTRCKLTKHQSHETDDFSEAADRSTDNLKESKIKLDKKISYLSNKHRVAQDNLRAAQGKRKASSEHARMQRDILVKRIRTVHDSVQRQIESSSTAVEKRLTRDAHSIQEELESYQHLRQTLHHALSADASQLDQIDADKSIREGSKRGLRKIRKSMPATTLRPGLHVFSENVSDEDISRALGTPVELSVEFTPRETMVLVFEYEDKKEVYSVCQRDSEDFSVFLWDPSSSETIDVVIDETGNMSREDRFCGQKTCKRYSKNGIFDSKCETISDEEESIFQLNSKGYRKMIFQIRHYAAAEKTSIFRIETSHEDTFKMKMHHVFDTNPVKPVAFDATSLGDVTALVETVEDEQSLRARKTKRQVCLYRMGQSTPFATYVPGDDAFCPSDVCFWQENGQDRLLVADSQNDCVHVVSIHEDRVGFERCLAAGDSTLVRPTALNVDDRGRVWVGCENGSVLLCKAVEMGPQVDSDESDEDDNSEISLETPVSDGEHSDHDSDLLRDRLVSDGEHSDISSLLKVDNSSHGTYDSCSSSETTRQWRNAQRRADHAQK